MTMSLVGSRVLVTGAGRGIGRAIAHILVEEGAKVAACSRTKSELEETAATATVSVTKDDSCIVDSENAGATETTTSTNDASSGIVKEYHPIEIFEVDLTDKIQVENMVSSLVGKWGGIDILINNAGRGQAQKGPAYLLDGEDLTNILNINVVSVHTVTSSVLRNSMRTNSNANGGRIINVSSRAAKKGFPNMSFYVTSKFALEGYSATLAQELKDDNIYVNTISPGMVDTQSFPKPAGRKGVRSAESIKDGLLLLLGSNKTGHYLHVDELDLVRAKGFDDSIALTPINEVDFSI